MNEKHTSGEWRIECTRAGNQKIMCGAKEICSDRGLNPGNNLEYVSEEERMANFLLMSKAPMMLNALKEILDQIKRRGTSAEIEGRNYKMYSDALERIIARCILPVRQD